MFYIYGGCFCLIPSSSLIPPLPSDSHLFHVSWLSLKRFGLFIHIRKITYILICVCISYTFKWINPSILPFCKAIHASVPMIVIPSKWGALQITCDCKSKVQPRRNPSWRTWDMQKYKQDPWSSIRTQGDDMQKTWKLYTARMHFEKLPFIMDNISVNLKTSTSKILKFVNISIRMVM